MQPMTDEEDELDLRHYVEVLRRRKMVVILATVLVTTLAVLVSLRQAPQYRATAEVLLQESEAEQILGPTADLQTPQENRVETEIGVIKSSVVRDAVEEVLGREPVVKVDGQGDTDIVEISATSTEPEVAAETANTYATVYVEWKKTNSVDQISGAIKILNEELIDIQDQLAGLQQEVDNAEREVILTEEGSEERLAAEERFTNVQSANGSADPGAAGPDHLAPTAGEPAPGRPADHRDGRCPGRHRGRWTDLTVRPAAAPQRGSSASWSV